MKLIRVVFKINGVTHSVGNELSPDTTLNDYIRSYAHSKGTKFMCLEGGCGSCMVCVKKTHPVTKKEVIFVVNSCLIPIFSCYGWSIIVVEGIGNKDSGYSEIQKALAGFSGTQCGYCSPGMVMNMFGILASEEKATMAKIENSFGGNICRCTGYRPILDAFKSLAVDATPDLRKQFLDIEDLTEGFICRSSGKVCINSCSEANGELCKKKYDIPELIVPNNFLHFELANGSHWYQALTISQIFEIFDLVQDNESYILVAGHTSHGVYRIGYHDFFIGISNITELQTCHVNDDNVVLGANMTLADAIKFLRATASQHFDTFAYLQDIAEHIEVIANVSVRNVGTLAGNLSIKHDHNEFPSDLFVILECASAQLTIGDISGIVNDYSLQEYLTLNMWKKVIYKITLPSYDSASYVYKSFKIMQRAQHTHAYVNAAFLCKIDGKECRITERPSIVFGGISPSFVHAMNTEAFLTGKKILNSDTLKQTSKILFSEIYPDDDPLEASPKYRKLLAVSLFYKFVLGLMPDLVSSQNKSGGQMLIRPLSSGKQDFDTDKSKWPLTEAIPKLEALIQCAGEAQYVGDIPIRPNQLYASFVISDRGPGKINSIDPSEALKMPGVISFLSAKDIPGKNTFVEVRKVDDEQLFADEEVKFAGQPVGVIVAVSQVLANNAANRVKVNIQLAKKIYVSVKEVVDDNVQSRIKLVKAIKPPSGKKIVTNEKTDLNITGSFLIGGQYHFTMETQTCFCVPTEDGLDVYPASQWITGIQRNISAALQLPQNSINIQVKRLGGAYGAKLGRSPLVATACAVTAYNMKVPIRMVVQLETNMRAVGKRLPLYAKYNIDVNETGVVKQLTVNVYSDYGTSSNDKMIGEIVEIMQSLYDSSSWTLNEYGVTTDCAPNVYCRAPGTTEAISLIEHIMEHIAAITQQDPTSVRLANLKSTEDVIPKMINDLKEISDYEERKKTVEAYNQQNRWKKKGIALVPMSYPFFFWGALHIIISVFAPDGTVSLTHGGIEMGQGINTKVAQVCAYVLGIALNKIKVKSSNVLTAPNDTESGGSMASDGVCYAALQCCKLLLERLKPIKEKYKNLTWEELIVKATDEDVDLCCEYMYAGSKSPDLKNFAIYGVTAIEVEIDVLTGQLQILRADILEDVGQSMSPTVDVGQVEGAFVMGLGYWLLEKLVYDKNTGKLLTDRTWNYTPPGAKDIPIDFRVHFRRNAPNPLGVLRSKATGEPPLCMSVSVVFAIKNALLSARKNAGSKENWFDISFPCTPENIALSSMTNIDQFNI